METQKDELITWNREVSIRSVTKLAKLPDKNQIIYVYCRSGRRSKETSAKLAVLGYSGIIECGGMLDWTGEIEK